MHPLTTRRAGGAKGKTLPRRRSAWRLVAVAVLLSAAACDEAVDADSDFPSFVGNVERGEQLVKLYGCGSCHVIPGTTGARGVVGPPLHQIGRRIYVAGVLRNTPQNMMFWLQNPQAVVPGNAMPDMGISRDQARDITAFLYTLR